MTMFIKQKSVKEYKPVLKKVEKESRKDKKLNRPSSKLAGNLSQKLLEVKPVRTARRRREDPSKTPELKKKARSRMREKRLSVAQQAIRAQKLVGAP